MKAKRQRHQAAFKAKVGLEALGGVKTVAEIAKEYQVHPTQVSQWKRAIVDRLRSPPWACFEKTDSKIESFG